MSRYLSLTCLALAGTVALTACAATPASRARAQAADASVQQRLAARLAGYTPGPPTDCIREFPTYHSEAIGSRIIYSADRSTLYVNETTGGCESMERGDYLVTVSTSGRLCRGDIGRTVTPSVNISSGSCALGSFTPYTRR
ncbi:MAG: hypothetical protein ACRYFW_06575 [Janthinobacterium lividum]